MEKELLEKELLEKEVMFHIDHRFRGSFPLRLEKYIAI